MAAGVLLLAAAWCALPAQAQLISPGKLSRAHQDLEGITNCTSCHRLGNKGVDSGRCLDCHTPLKTRIDGGRGFHARLADRNCADCHKEHFGPAFQLVRLDTARFDHAETGFRLTGAHTRAACRSCHRPALITAADVRAFKGRHGALERTFLGLGTRCLSCHEPDTPHAGQFAAEDCTTCHTTDQWDGAARFDHGAARFALAGRHRQVDCEGCHPRATAPGGASFTRYEGLAFANCSACHRDAHGGAFGADCRGCHTPDGWQQIRNFAEDRFDHAATGFDLVGRHARLDCAACHARPARQDPAIRLAFARGTEGRTYPRIQVEDCLSCHTDYHAGVFAEAPGGTGCDNCHGQDAWFPTAYGLDRHNAQTRFALTGAHLATPCTACHRGDAPTPVFRFDDLACGACHAADNPHGAQFADAEGTTACEGCHTPDGWRLDAFDHEATGFSLTGLHATVACAACHTPQPDAQGRAVQQFRGLPTDCRGCHAPDDPHAGQFEDRPCAECHTTQGFAAASRSFDHNRTRFPLTGAHQQAACGQCHRTETAPDGAPFVRYRPLGLACKDCHDR